MKTYLAAVLGSVVLTAGALLGAPAASGAQTAPYPSTPIDIWLGASSIRGTLTWYGSPVAAGAFRSVGCNRMWSSAYDASGNELAFSSTNTQCDMTSAFNIAFPRATESVEICLVGANPARKCEWYNRP
ncbi:hypothetical protein [Streptomyces sp. NPDC012510]|uniref:hypothetical protein n=1 Tax=Streptomyces sp. NPDC012510 TaxID=3364838 RepID=UPI0036E7636D